MKTKKIHILGTRGVPAQHGGFETFAENFAPYLVEKGWDVTVYCQADWQENAQITRDMWQGVKRVIIPVKERGNFTSMIFDWKATVEASKEKGLFLILGYNTAVYAGLLRLKRKKVIFNMDGFEWKRPKWPWHGKLWFYLNEWAGAWLGNHLIADHPEIKKHLLTRIFKDKVTTITYGSRVIKDGKVDILSDLGIEAGNYVTVIARPEPENNTLEIVRAWSAKQRGCKLVVLGHFNRDHPYHTQVLDAAGDEVIFPGGIYEPERVDALRHYCKFYFHGHTVGGTNPSLVEALGAGNAVLAHNNKFNRWVAGEGAVYFKDEVELANKIGILLDNQRLLNELKEKARTRHSQAFTWPVILKAYEDLVEKFI